jgi:hypothetical protein
LPGVASDESKRLAAKHARVSQQYGTPADERIREAVALRQELLVDPHISPRSHVGIIAATMQQHRNTVYRWLRLADSNPGKYKPK